MVCNKAKAVFSGAYQVAKDGIQVSYSLTDNDGRILASRVANLKPASYQNYQYKPTTVDFDRLLRDGYAVASDFNVQMSGARYTNGKFLNRREYAYYWSSSSKDKTTAWNRYFPHRSKNSDHFPTDKNHSFSIRCVKND